MRISRRLLTKYLAIASAPIIIAAVAIGAIAVRSPDSLYSIKGLNLTTRAATPNLIEVYTGGFDLNSVNAQLSSRAAFKDFKNFKHVYGVGESTLLSQAVGMGGFREYNPAALYARHQSSADWTDAVTNSEFAYGVRKHLSVGQNRFNQQVLLGLNDIVASGGQATRSGDATFADRILSPGVEIVSWTGARNLITGSIGFTDTAFDNLELKAFNKVAAASNQSTQGTRVLIQADFTRAPRQVGLSGNYDFSVSPSEAVLAQTSALESLIAHLKSLVDANGRSVYDNSMIVFWGSHNSALTAQISNGVVAPASLLIKYPNQVQTQIEELSDALVSLGQLNHIVFEYFVNRPEDTMALFKTAPYSTTRQLAFQVGGDSAGIAFGALASDRMLLTGAPLAMSDSRVSSAALFAGVVGGVDI